MTPHPSSIKDTLLVGDLLVVGHSFQGPWFTLRNFNAILSKVEKIEGGNLL
jgi:hypothetical protein